MNIEITDKEAINKILNSKEPERQYLLKKINLGKNLRIIGITTLSSILFITFILGLQNAMGLGSFICSIPLVFIELYNLKMEWKKKEFTKNLKSNIIPILMKYLQGIEKTNNAFDVNDIESSGLFSNKVNYDEDDAFICNYKDKKAYISEGETFEYSSEDNRRCNIKRWLLIGFYTKKGLNHQTVIKTKTKFNNILRKLPIIILGTFFISFALFWSYLYYISLYENKSQYLSNTTQCIINLGFPIIFIAIAILFFCIMLIPKINNWIKKEKVTLEDAKLMKFFNIKSSNQFEARYFLTPSFIEKFLKVQDTFKTKDLRCSFYRNKVIIAIGIKEDFFEVANLNEPLISQKYIRKTLKQLNTIKKIIFALDEDK